MQHRVLQQVFRLPKHPRLDDHLDEQRVDPTVEQRVSQWASRLDASTDRSAHRLDRSDEWKVAQQLERLVSQAQHRAALQKDARQALQVQHRAASQKGAQHDSQAQHRAASQKDAQQDSQAQHRAVLQKGAQQDSQVQHRAVH